MKQLYYFDSNLDYILSKTQLGHGFGIQDVKKEDNDYFYYDGHYSEHRVCKKTYKEQYVNFYTGSFTDDEDRKTFYPTRELWEKAKSEYFAKLLNDNEADKQKILKSMGE